MTNDIYAVCDSYVHCNRNAPYQAAIPLVLSNPPATRFESTFADRFDYEVGDFQGIEDRFSGWADVLARHLV